MNYMEIKTNSIENGEGFRVALFVSGCDIHCVNCHNPESWSFSAGEEFTDDTMKELCNELKKNHVKGLSILGGEPLAKQNIMDTLRIASAVKYVLPNKDIWLYTGYAWEEVEEKIGHVKDIFDVIVSEPYIDELHTNGKFYGSENQTIRRRSNKWSI